MRRMLPRKLIRKLIPKIGIIISITSEYVIKFLFALRK